MARHRASLVTVAAAALLSSGCITSTTLVKLRPDGSGTLEATMLVNTALFKDLGAMAGGEMRMTGRADLPSPEDMVRQLTQLKGVRLVSNTPVKDGTMEGARVVLAFDDVNQIVINEGVPGRAGQGQAAEPVRFALERRPGGTSHLTITFPEESGQAGRGSAPVRETQNQPRSRQRPETAPGKVNPEMVQLLGGFLKGMRLLVALDVEGTLVRSSSPWVDGNRVTLFELDMDRLLADPAALERLDALPLDPAVDMRAARAAMDKAGVTGLKINDPTITIEFR